MEHKTLVEKKIHGRAGIETRTFDHQATMLYIAKRADTTKTKLQTALAPQI